MKLSKGPFLLKSHLPPHNNSPLCWKVNPKSLQSLVIPHKDVIFCSEPQLCPLLKRDMRISQETKYAKVAYLRLLPCEHLLRVLHPKARLGLVF